MNAVYDLVTATGASAGTEDIQAFKDFCEFRKMCANAAKKVIANYK